LWGREGGTAALRKLPARLCLVLGLALAGCAPSASEWTPAEAPTVLRTTHLRYHYLAAFAPGSDQLGRNEDDKFAAFLARAGVRPGDRLYLVPAASDRLAAARIDRLARELDRRGLGAETLPAASGVAADHLLVLADRYVVTLPACPNWTKDPIVQHDNRPASNFGCATATNLGLMIADPRDLEVGRTLGPADAEPTIDAVARYRTGKVKPLAGGSGGMEMSVSPAGTTSGGQ
jgi:pilus assembly protein CpaD